MKVTVYGIRNCDTIKKTLAWLDQHGVEYHFHDYKREGVPSERLAAWAKVVGWERLAKLDSQADRHMRSNFNTR